MGNGLCLEEWFAQAKSESLWRSNSSFELRDAKWTVYSMASENGLTIFLYVNGRLWNLFYQSLVRKNLKHL